MKTKKEAFFGMLVLLLSIALFPHCKSNEPTPTEGSLVIKDTATVVGFYPCTARSPFERGLLLAFKTDTLFTFNLPHRSFDYPEQLFDGYRVNFWFPRSHWHRVAVTYTLKTEQTIVGCTADINLADFMRFRLRKKEVSIVSYAIIE